jgi:hypothetical protein
LTVPTPGAPRLYLAGKISKNCWRHALVPNLRGTLDGYDLYDNHRGDLGAALRAAPLLPSSNGRWRFAGPYFAADDHGCGHFTTSHGLGYGCINYGAAPPRQVIAAACLQWIDRSDGLLVNALEPLDQRHGTLVEMGYALARKLPVWVVVGPDRHRDWMLRKQVPSDWFAWSAATRVLVANRSEDALGDAADAFADWLLHRSTAA